MTGGPGRARRLAIGATAAPIVLLVVLGLLAPWLAPADPNLNALGSGLQSPSAEHWLGTDQLGRDQLSRLLYAARVSLLITATVLTISISVGLLVGVVAGYVGGVVDALAVRLIDLTLTLPSLLIALAVIGVRGPGTSTIVWALASTGWAPYARIARSRVRAARTSTHVDALRVLGASRTRIVGRHLLSTAVGPALVYASTDLGTVVLTIATLSFLGLGVAPPDAEWGAMLVDARPFLDSAWWLAYPPGIAITAVVFSANMLGERIAAPDERSRPASLLLGRRAQRIRRTDGQSGEVAAAAPADGPRPRPLLDVHRLSVTYPGPAGPSRVLAEVSYRVHAGEILALVGESGSGKTSALLAPWGLLGAQAGVSGSAVIAAAPPAEPVGGPGQELVGADLAVVRRCYGRFVGVVFQDSLGALNPVRTIASGLDQAIRAAGVSERAAVRGRRQELLDLVGLPEVGSRYPHQLSGGMRQRVQLAMAVAGRPRLLIADEPTSALDVTVQAEILGLLRRFRDELGMAVVIVTHDLGVVTQIADTVAVLYAGRVVESGPVEAVLGSPDHPYTRGLLAAVPDPAIAPGTPFLTLPGAPGAGPDAEAGCTFAPRCALAEPACRTEVPALAPLRSAAHVSRCRRRPSMRHRAAARFRGGVDA